MATMDDGKEGLYRKRSGFSVSHRKPGEAPTVPCPVCGHPTKLVRLCSQCKACVLCCVCRHQDDKEGQNHG